MPNQEITEDSYSDQQPLTVNNAISDIDLTLNRFLHLGLERFASRISDASLLSLSIHFSDNIFSFLDISSETLLQRSNNQRFIHIQTLIRDILDMPDFDIFEEIYNETNIDLRTYTETINTITNATVFLAENDNIKISLIDSIHVTILGYFDKNDSRIILDFRNINTFLILDDRYIKYYIKVFAKISTEGDLIFENNYSLGNQYMQSKLKNLPEVDLKGNKSLITEELLKDESFKKYYIEDINSGCFYKKNELTNGTKTIMSTKKYGKQYRKFKGIFGDFAKSIENIPDTYQNTFGKKYQFGIEIETISGYLPLYLDNILYYSAVHDGSLRDMETGSVYGAEYVSDVLWGDLGLLQLKKLCYELTKRCLIDKRCGELIATL